MKILRFLFILGFVFWIILTFIPSYSVEVTDLFGFEKKTEIVSQYKIIQESFRHKPGLAFLFVVIFAIDIAFVVLALAYPKRWVFLSGAIFGAFFLLLSLFSPSEESVKLLILPKVINYIAYVLVFTGFFIKEEKKRLRLDI